MFFPFFNSYYLFCRIKNMLIEFQEFYISEKPLYLHNLYIVYLQFYGCSSIAQLCCDWRFFHLRLFFIFFLFCFFFIVFVYPSSTVRFAILYYNLKTVMFEISNQTMILFLSSITPNNLQIIRISFHFFLSLHINYKL